MRGNPVDYHRRDARQFLRGAGLAVVLMVCGALCACSTAAEKYDEGSAIPWNAPEQWERQPSTGAPFTW